MRLKDWRDAGRRNRFAILFASLLLAGIKVADDAVGSVLSQAIYYSFVTLATVGYGDISPATALARGLANIESIIGQLYLAVLIARLVSLHGSQQPGGLLKQGNSSQVNEALE